jgi:hypothetical protein
VEGLDVADTALAMLDSMSKPIIHAQCTACATVSGMIGHERRRSYDEASLNTFASGSATPSTRSRYAGCPGPISESRRTAVAAIQARCTRPARMAAGRRDGRNARGGSCCGPQWITV